MWEQIVVTQTNSFGPLSVSQIYVFLLLAPRPYPVFWYGSQHWPLPRRPVLRLPLLSFPGLLCGLDFHQKATLKCIFEHWVYRVSGILTVP